MLDNSESTDPTATLAPPLSGDGRVAAWLRGSERSVLRQMVEMVARPGLTSMAGGLPTPELFPRRELAEAYAEVLGSDERALQYLPPHEPLLEQICGLMERRGVACRPDEVLLTTGAQQALDIAGRLLIDADDAVACEEHCYTGIFQANAPRRGRLIPLRADLDSGIDPLEAESAFARENPRLLYCVPEGHNPLGVTLSGDRREALVEAAGRHGVVLLEDDPYGFVSLDGPASPALASLDRERTIYAGSFSKILGPALRLGWMIAPADLKPRAQIIKEGLDLECSSLTQRVVSSLLEREAWFESHLDRVQRTYRGRRDAVLAAIAECAPPGVEWSRPSSGMFVWLRFDAQIFGSEFDTRDLLRHAIDHHKLAFIPGAAFDCSEDERGRRGLRLSYSLLSPDELTVAVRELFRAVEGFMAQN